jgi:hypothetical protein
VGKSTKPLTKPWFQIVIAVVATTTILVAATHTAAVADLQHKIILNFHEIYKVAPTSHYTI